MAGESCVLYPKVNGEDSKLYKGLLELSNGNRLIANYVYAHYLAGGISESMTSLGYTVNDQNEHNAQDVFKFLNVNQIIIDSTNNNMALSVGLGFIKSGKLVDMSRDEAYTKANSFNKSHDGKIAYVVQHNDKFNVIIDDKDSSTLSKLNEFNRQQVAWESFFESLRARGLSPDLVVSSVGDGILNPITLSDWLTSFDSLKFLKTEDLSLNDIKSLLLLNGNNKLVETLTTRFGNAEEMYRLLTSPNSLGNAAYDFLFNSLKSLKTSGVNFINSIENELQDKVDLFTKSNLNSKIQSEINRLHSRFGINKVVINRTNSEISKLSDAVSEAILTIEKQLRELRNRKDFSKDLENELINIQETLLTELNQKRYYQGLLTFLNQALKYSGQITQLMSTTTHGSRMDQIKQKAGILAKERNIRNAYYTIVKSLANMDTLMIDTNMSAEEREALTNMAKKVCDIIEKQGIISHNVAQQTMIDLLMETLGDDPSMSAAIANMVSMGDTNTTIMDFLYSVGRASNPLISAMGQVIRDAQTDRDQKLAQVSARIRRATNKFYSQIKKQRGVGETDFMYDEDGIHIISDIDWDKYNKDWSKYKAGFSNTGLSEAEINRMMDSWEEAHTVEVTHGALTERIPNSNYRKAMPQLTEAQREYYDTMLEIMGDLCSLLPDKYQTVYAAPQIEKGWHQLFLDGVNGKIGEGDKNMSSKDKLKKTVNLLLDRMKFWKKRANSTEYGQINGQPVAVERSDFDSTRRRTLPIFYRGKLEDKDNLLMNYSMAIQMFASSALNYDAMNEIQDTVEMIEDYVKGLGSTLSRDGKISADVLNKQTVTVVKNLINSRSLSGDVAALAEGFVEAQLYGIKNVSDSNVARTLQGLISYTSWKGLTLNFAGGFSNYLVGEAQMLIEAGAKEYYNTKDYLRAHAILIGSQTTGASSAIMDLIAGNLTSKYALIAQMFDPNQDLFGKLANERYYKNPFRQIFGGFDTGFLYSAGESVLHSLNMYSVLCHEKVNLNGKTVSLYDVLEKVEATDGTAEIRIKQGATTLDGNNIDKKYIDGIRRRIRYVNQTTHGAMNSEDKGLISRHIAGRLVMNFRQWMVEHYSRRFRLKHYDESARDISLTNFYIGTKVIMNGKKVSLYDAFDKIPVDDGSGAYRLVLKSGIKDLKGKMLTNERINEMLTKYRSNQGWREGYYVTTFNFVKACLKEYQGFKTSIIANWDSLTDPQKANIRRTLSEMEVILALFGLSFALGAPDDNRGKAFKRYFIYQIKRLQTDELASIPNLAMVKNAFTIINKPIASLDTVDKLMYPIAGFTDLWKTIQTGRDAGKNKYWRNILKYDVPFYQQLRNLRYIAEDNNMFLPFM